MCDFCDDVYHINCLNLPELKPLTQAAIDKLGWHCHKCKADISLIEIDNLKTRVTQWKAKYQELNAQHQNLVDKLVNVKTEINSTQQFSDVLKTRPSNAHEQKKTPVTREDHVLVMKPKSNKCKLTDIQNTSIANTLKSCPIIN